MRSGLPSSRPYLLAGLVWLGVAIALGASGRIAHLRPPAPRLVVAGLTVALLVAGSRLGLADPASMAALLLLPPTFLVPLIIASHVLIFARLTRPKG